MNRTRHYAITLQRMGEDGVMRYTTHHGDFHGDANEGEAFERIWDEANAKATEMYQALGVSGTWTRDNTSVLLYRLKDQW